MSEAVQNNEPRKIEFFSSLALRYRKYFPLHVLGGQTQRNKDFGKETITTPSGKEIERYKRWGDPTQHCLVETAVAEDIAERLNLSTEDKMNLTIAAFTHDAGKRREIEEARGVTDPQVISKSYQKSKDLLIQNGVPIAAVELTERVAHTSLPYFAQLNADNSISLRDGVADVEMAMHYIDDITRGTDIVALDERMDYLDSVADKRYPYNQEGREVWGGRTFFQAQREIGHLIENRLAAKIGVEDPKTLPLVLKNSLMEQIAAA